MTIRAILALSWREFLRFVRQPQRVIGSIGQPILFWLFLGTGFSRSFKPPGMENIAYIEFFYPGVLLMILLFASIFSSITVIEDRDQGFLQSVLVAPVSRLAVVFGKVLGGTSIAFIQGILLLLLIPFLNISMSGTNLLLLILCVFLSAFGFTILGFLCAWSMKSTAGFHAIMMLFLMPLWLLSGALFPIQYVPDWLHTVMDMNPVTHALAILRLPLYQPAVQVLTNHSFLISLSAVVFWIVVCTLLALVQVKRREHGIIV